MEKKCLVKFITVSVPQTLEAGHIYGFQTDRANGSPQSPAESDLFGVRRA